MAAILASFAGIGLDESQNSTSKLSEESPTKPRLGLKARYRFEPWLTPEGLLPLGQHAVVQNAFCHQFLQDTPGNALYGCRIVGVLLSDLWVSNNSTDSVARCTASIEVSFYEKRVASPISQLVLIKIKGSIHGNIHFSY